MAYTVLARRYRSTNFDEVVGQEHVAQTLKRAIESGRIAHAYLFCGTRGTGKTSTARILAKALNCEKSDGPTSHPCGVCNSCQAVARGEDMDVIEIDAASNTGVDNVRQLIENAQYRPAHSRFKVYIIDEVHMLSKAAFNALLKTMEEPPPHVKFILATTEPEKVLPTILSRCQRYDFRNIPTQEIARHLRNIVTQEQIEADDDALLMVAKAGAGSMRDSLSLLDRLLSIGEKKLTLEMIEGLLGLPKSQLVFNLAQSIGAGDVRGTLTQVDAMLASGLSPDTLLVSLVEHFRNLLVLRTCGPEAGLVEVPGLPLKDLTAQANQFDATALTQDITILEELRRLLRQAMASRALLDATLVRLTLADQFTSIADLLAAADGAPVSAGQKKKPEPVEGSGFRVRGSGGEAGMPAGVGGPRPVASAAPPVTGGSDGASPSSVALIAPAPAGGVSTPSVTFTNVTNTDLDLDDDLPRPGKVWDDSGPSLAEMLKAKGPVEAPAEVAAAARHPDSNIAPVGAADLPGIWRNLLSAIQEQPGLLAMLQQGRFVGFDDDGTAVVAANNSFAKASLDRNGKKDLIRDTLSKILNKPVGLKIIVDEGAAGPGPVAGVTPKAQAAPAVPANPAHRVVAEAPPAPVVQDNSVRLTPELREQLRQDPFVKGVLETVGGDIIKVEQ